MATKKPNPYKEYMEFVVDRLQQIYPNISARAMFGGYGIYHNKKIFASIIEGELYFKTDKALREIYKNLDSKPFTFDIKGKKIPETKLVEMPYWTLPDDIFEDDFELKKFMDLSINLPAKI